MTQSGPLSRSSGKCPAAFDPKGLRARRYSRWVLLPFVILGLRIVPRNYKASNGNLNVTGGKRSPILNSCQPTVLENCRIFREEGDQTTLS